MDLTQLVLLREAGAFAIMAGAFVWMFVRWPKQFSAPIVQAIETIGVKFTAALDANTKALEDLTRR